jgi:hypothetical protein
LRLEKLEDRQLLSYLHLTSVMHPTFAVEGELLGTDPSSWPVVADFQTNLNLSDVGATITWADGAQTSGMVYTGTEGPIVLGTHTYEEAILSPGRPFKVSVSGDGLGDSMTVPGATVADAGLHITNVTHPHVSEGQPINSAVVAHFTDDSIYGTASDYTATITWLDGNITTVDSTATSDGQIVPSGNGFDVLASYTYREATDLCSFIVRVDDEGGAWDCKGIQGEVADAPVKITSVTPPVAVEQQQITGAVIAHFTDENPDPVLKDFFVEVDWPDGSSPTITSTPSEFGQIVVNPDGGYDVLANYWFQKEFPTSPLTVTVNDVGGSSDSMTVDMTVQDAPLTMTSVAHPVGVMVGQGIYSFAVAQGTSPNVGSESGDLSATITWADGMQTPGSVIPAGSDGFEVLGTYTYQRPVTSGTLTVTVNDVGGASATGTATGVNVADAPITIDGVFPTGGDEGKPIVNAGVAHFTHGMSNSDPGYMTALITWADGTQTSGNVVTASGGYNVLGTYTYPEEVPAGRQLTVFVRDGAGAHDQKSTTESKIWDAPLTIVSGTIFTPVEGHPYQNVPIIHFLDEDPNGVPGDYTARVNWGDGTTSTITGTAGAAGQIVAAGDGFDVLGTHTYAEEISRATFSIQLADAGGSVTYGSIDNFSVADAPLTAGPLTPPNAMEGVPFADALLLHFTDADPGGAASDYTATITWGDGSTSTVTSKAGKAGQIKASAGGGFDVLGSHTYAEELSGAVFHVHVADAGGAVTDADNSNFNVSDAPLTAGAWKPPVATEGIPFANQLLFHFTDANPQAKATDYTATIAWGDGTVSTLTSAVGPNGRIVANSRGGFDVLGSHTYAEDLSGATFAVQVADAGGAKTGASKSGFGVADAPLTAGALTPPKAVEGAPFAKLPLFHFTDANPGAKAEEFTATITWGDGTTSTVTSTESQAGQIKPGDKGGFDVLGSHTYAEELGGGTFSVQVLDLGGAKTIAAKSKFSVAEAPVVATGVNVQAVQKAAFFGQTVATFTDPGGAEPNPSSPGTIAKFYSATIAWGDGKTSTGVIQYNGQPGSTTDTFTVVGDHTYSAKGAFKVTVVIKHEGVSTKVTSVATVSIAASPAASAAQQANLIGGEPSHDKSLAARDAALAGWSFAEGLPLPWCTRPPTV